MTNIQIALLGKETLPVYYPVKTEGADEVYIIRSNQNEEEAKRLKTVLEEEHIPCHIDNVVGAFDLKSINEVCENIHTKLPEDCSVTYNVTGGTKPMFIGALWVARKHSARVLYTDSESLFDLTNGEKTSLNVKMDLNTFFTLQGQKLKSSKPHTYDESVLKCCNKIMRKIIKNPKDFYNVYEPLRNVYEKQPTLKLLEFKDKKAIFTNDQLTAYSNGIAKFTFMHPRVMELVFAGRWWEELVANAVAKWANGRYDVWQNVTFYTKEEKKDKVKNEIDILVNLGTKVLFIECKSGSTDQNVINKMAFIRQNYGSDKSESILISFRTVREDLKEKAKDSKIMVIDYDNNAKVPALEQISTGITETLSTLKA